MWPTSERCPSWPKERDWKSRTCGNVGRGFESTSPLALTRLEESDQIRELLLRELLAEVARHDPLLVALCDLRIWVDDRLFDERCLPAL